MDPRECCRASGRLTLSFGVTGWAFVEATLEISTVRIAGAVAGVAGCHAPPGLRRQGGAQLYQMCMHWTTSITLPPLLDKRMIISKRDLASATFCHIATLD